MASTHNDKVIAMTRIFCKPKLSLASAAMFGTVLLHSGTASAAATISRSVDVRAAARDVWSLIGPFCAIRDWLPPVGQCIEDGKAPSTRILVTKDGKAAFVETQVARTEAEHSYSYKFLTSPLPVSNYTANDQGDRESQWLFHRDLERLYSRARAGEGRQRCVARGL